MEFCGCRKLDPEYITNSGMKNEDWLLLYCGIVFAQVLMKFEKW